MLTIGKLASACDVGVETIRFYQRKGLLRIPEREGGVRHYGNEDLRRLRFIRKAQAAGFALTEIHELLGLDASHDHQRARELARTRIEALEERIRELQQARDSLQQLAAECESENSGPCPILASFGV
ncbi:MerR family transcriptional regulator [Halovibrio salipaludis]|uniref:Mercuric resistance operon regulatory protein n=1 Tax=Halovibrio salipaludis TaxID=2032626 RepID=A0A2A2F203_9GAMM|nr:MerR family transcriptional regulator [Halovibrio salipaludis]PAU79641.1 MerR family transcriptional regulator [Halovibrio salipaludis]